MFACFFLSDPKFKSKQLLTMSMFFVIFVLFSQNYNFNKKIKKKNYNKIWRWKHGISAEYLIKIIRKHFFLFLIKMEKFIRKKISERISWTLFICVSNLFVGKLGDIIVSFISHLIILFKLN